MRERLLAGCSYATVGSCHYVLVQKPHVMNGSCYPPNVIETGDVLSPLGRSETLICPFGLGKMYSGKKKYLQFSA